MRAHKSIGDWHVVHRVTDGFMKFQSAKSGVTLLNVTDTARCEKRKLRGDMPTPQHG